jgi:hypothetical protein
MTSDTVQSDSAMDQKGRRGNPSKVNDSPYFLDLFLYLSFFSVVGKEAGRRWEIMQEDVGCVGAIASFIAPVM